jgi:hypothetical protein
LPDSRTRAGNDCECDAKDTTLFCHLSDS